MSLAASLAEASALSAATKAQTEKIEGLVTAASVLDNPSGITPTEYNVVVLVDEVQDKTKGGVILPDEHRERRQGGCVTGRLVAIAPLAFTYADAIGAYPRSGWLGPVPQPGWRVVLAKYSGLEVEGRDGRKYKILKDKDVVAFLENDNA